MKTTWILGVVLIGAATGIGAQRPAKPVAILDNSGMLIGASRAGKWISAEKVHGLLKPGDRYRTYTLKGLIGNYVGGKTELSEASGQAYYIRFPKKEPSENNENISVGGSWNAMPRLSRPDNPNQAVYLDTVKSVLEAHKLPSVKPNIVRILRVDLFGRGQDAVLIEAASPNYKLSTGFEGDPAVVNTYSCVILRMLVNGKVRTDVLGGAFYYKGGSRGPVEQYRIANVLDLNGDGVLEIVVTSHYYEGGGAAVFEVKSGRPKRVLAEADGA